MTNTTPGVGAANTQIGTSTAALEAIARPHFGHDIVDGVHYVWRDPAMRTLVIMRSGTNLCISGPIIVGLASTIF